MGRPIEAVETIEVPPPNGRKAPERRTGGAMVYEEMQIAEARVLEILKPFNRAARALIYRHAGEKLAHLTAEAVPERDRLPEQDPYQ